MSDQEIADKLRREDVLIARRTVAKYRGMLGVLSSSKRKKPGLPAQEPAEQSRLLISGFSCESNPLGGSYANFRDLQTH